MTCIVGIAQGGDVWLGGDSAGWIGSVMFPHDNGKIFKSGEFLLGTAGDRRFGEIVRFSFSPPLVSYARDGEVRLSPNVTDVSDLDWFMSVRFIDALKKCCESNGYLESRNGRSALTEGDALLVGVRGKLYYVSENFSASGVSGGEYAIGCGWQFALGALSTGEVKNPESRIRAALRAAEVWGDGVRAPFHVISTKGEGDGKETG